MSERFSSESHPESVTDADIEMAIDYYLYDIDYRAGQELGADDIMAILSKLIESGPELDAHYREALRAKIRRLLGGRPDVRLASD